MKICVLALFATALFGQVPRDVFREPATEYRGKILAVVSSTGVNPNSGKSIGYELTELSRAWYLFEANGYEVEVASPKGGPAPAVMDDEDMTDLDNAFLADPAVKAKLDHTHRMDRIDPGDYRAIYFVGGKGAFFDFPDAPHIQKAVVDIYENGGVVSAVCHGPAALVNVKLTDDSYLIEGMKISSFTNKEELLLNKKAETVYPFLLEDRLIERGAVFEQAPLFLNNSSVDGRLVTGQNPWSTWAVAENTIRALGHEPVSRIRTANEATVETIAALRSRDLKAAHSVKQGSEKFDHIFLASYTVATIIDGDAATTLDLIRLSDYTWVWVVAVLTPLTLALGAFLLVRMLFRKTVAVFRKRREAAPT